ncbi:MAG: peptidase [Alphaproteobacteria bacterium]|nr:MAG: peptidase [Alphaproteobacteria bacterium]
MPPPAGHALSGTTTAGAGRGASSPGITRPTSRRPHSMPRIRHSSFLLILALIGGLCVPRAIKAVAQTAAPALPFGDEFAQAPVDPAAPSPAAVLGHAPGERITPPKDAVRYLHALARAMPQRVRLTEFAHSWEGRPLVVATISGRRNIARLEKIRDAIARLADPRIGAGKDRLRERIDDLPATVWLTYAVHGNEISSTDAAIAAAYYLAAGEDARAKAIRHDAIVFIVPVQNPDGRARFIHEFRQALGLVPQADRFAAEHDEPWPSGRVNHYLFDLNRDWLRATQPEIRGQIAAMRDWKPLVVVDAHEMEGDESYFFSPEAPPFNPFLTRTQIADLAIFGRANARYFDRYGIDYFTREIFDAFYPGYGASWPSYYGGIAMTYEQASPRGLVYRRRDGRLLTYRQAVRDHFLTSIATTEAAAANRETLWRHFADYRASAIEEGRKGPVASYLLPGERNPDGAARLARLLAFHGIEVRRLKAPRRLCGRALAAGARVIDAAQPESRRLRTLLERESPMDEAFLARQRERRAKGLPDEIYDITAWSLPLLMNVEAVPCRTHVATLGEAIAPPAPAALDLPVRPGHLTVLKGMKVPRAVIAAWRDAASARLLAAALASGLSVKSADEAFEIAGRRYPAGSLIFEREDNPSDLLDRLRDLADRTGADLDAVTTSWVEKGPSFGSNRTRPVPAARVALAWDAPTNPYQTGAIRWIVEQRFGWPVTPIRVETLPYADLDRYDVLILPDARGDYRRRLLDTEGGEAIARWVRKGGTLVAFSGALDLLADRDVGLLSSRREGTSGEAAAEAEEADKSDEADEAGATKPPAALEIADEEEYRRLTAAAPTASGGIAGAILKAKVETDHWLAFGLSETVYPLVTGQATWRPLTVEQGTDVVHFAAADEQPVAGVLWKESRRRFAFKPLVMVEPAGQGFVIAFTQDTASRAYQDGLDLLLVNAIFRGPQHSGRLR